eukprot:6188004-Pleurochrysis_carterae.AAC.2
MDWVALRLTRLGPCRADLGFLHVGKMNVGCTKGKVGLIHLHIKRQIGRFGGLGGLICQPRPPWRFESGPKRRKLISLSCVQHIQVLAHNTARFPLHSVLMLLKLQHAGLSSAAQFAPRPAKMRLRPSINRAYCTPAVRRIACAATLLLRNIRLHFRGCLSSLSVKQSLRHGCIRIQCSGPCSCLDRGFPPKAHQFMLRALC